MKNDSWLRGALLSALFFALLIGGALTIVAANQSPTSVVSAHVSPTTCMENGGFWVYEYNNLPTRGHCQTNKERCGDLAQSLLKHGITGTAGGVYGAGTSYWEPLRISCGSRQFRLEAFWIGGRVRDLPRHGERLRFGVSWWPPGAVAGRVRPPRGGRAWVGGRTATPSGEG